MEQNNSFKIGDIIELQLYDSSHLLYETGVIEIVDIVNKGGNRTKLYYITKTLKGNISTTEFGSLYLNGMRGYRCGTYAYLVGNINNNEALRILYGR